MKCQVPKCGRNSHSIVTLDGKELEICKHHLEDTKDYEVKDFLLVHSTWEIEKVLNSGYVKSARDAGIPIEETWFEEYRYFSEEFYEKNKESYMTSVFTAVLFPERKNGKVVHSFEEPHRDKGESLLVFKSDVIQESEHWCSGWYFSRFDKSQCIKYDRSISLKDNLNLWREAFVQKEMLNYYSVYGFAENEVIFKKPVPLEGNLLYIKVHKNRLQEMREKYPQYRWVSRIE